MNKGLRVKDFVRISLFAAVYMLLVVVCMLLISPLGQFGHVISPGFYGLLTGTIIVFINRKIGKMWEYTIFCALIMAVFTLMGGGYLPWIASTMVMAVIADLIASRSNRTPIPLVATASGLIHVGQAFGAVIPANFFMESFREHWIERGRIGAADMDQQIHFARGILGLMSTAIVFVLAFAGVIIGYLILRKHLEKTEGNE